MTIRNQRFSLLKQHFFLSVSRIGSDPQLKRAMKHICLSSILLGTMLLFLYLICLKLGWIPYFQFILGTVGGHLATRVASFLRGLVVIIGGGFGPWSVLQYPRHTPHREYDVAGKSFWPGGEPSFFSSPTGSNCDP